MTKTVKVLLGITVIGAIGTVIYILTHDKKTEVETVKDTPVAEPMPICNDENATMPYETPKVNWKVDGMIPDEPDKVGEIVEDLMENAEDAIEDFVETAEVKVEEAKEEVKQHTDEVVKKIKERMEKSMNYDIPPYEISHDTYLSNDSGFNKCTVFYLEEDNKFITVYNEEVKPFVLGRVGEEFISNPNYRVIYIRNEKLGVDYAVYKGEFNG